MRKEWETRHMSCTNKEGAVAALVLMGEPETSSAGGCQFGIEHRKGAGTEFVKMTDVRPRRNRARRTQ